MIIDHQTDSMVVTKREGCETKGFVMDDPNLFIGMYRDTIYKDKLRVIPQEYMSNARDANREAGKGDVNIRVEMPTVLDPILKISDDGIGINEERSSIFSRYGASTKRDSNGQNGGFGIGCKCAWSYTESFTVDTVFEEDGRKIRRMYSVYITNKADPGNIRTVSESECDPETPTGTTVSIPIMVGDLEEVQQSVRTVTAWWPTKAQITNKDECEWYPRHMRIETAEKGKGWVRYFCDEFYSVGESIVVLDGIPYNLDLDKLLAGISQYEDIEDDTVEVRYAIEQRYIDLLKHQNYALFFDTGDIEMAPDRENLIYDANSIQKIQERVHSIYNKVMENARKQIAESNGTLLELLKIAEPLLFFSEEACPDELKHNGQSLIKIANDLKQITFSVYELVKGDDGEYYTRNLRHVEDGFLENCTPGCAVVFYGTDRGRESAKSHICPAHFEGMNTDRIILAHIPSHRINSAGRNFISKEFCTHNKLKRKSISGPKREKIKGVIDGLTAKSGRLVNNISELEDDAIVVRTYRDENIYEDETKCKSGLRSVRGSGRPVYYATPVAYRTLKKNGWTSFLTMDRHKEMVRQVIENCDFKIQVAFRHCHIDIPYLDEVIDWCGRNNKIRSAVILRAFKMHEDMDSDTKYKYSSIISEADELDLLGEQSERMYDAVNAVWEDLPFSQISVSGWRNAGRRKQIMKNIIATYQEVAEEKVEEDDGW